MQTIDYFKILVEDIHTTVMATLDESGQPITCAIDIMDYDTDGLYFLTARGKHFYHRLKACPTIALTAIKGSDTLSSVSLSLQGQIRELGPDRLPILFSKNRYMEAIYPTEASRSALTVFHIYQGTGEWFDLSRQPIERATFAFGGAALQTGGYHITARCTGCGLCLSHCPQNCIDLSTHPAQIQAANCLHCGNCYTVCPAQAVEKY